MVKSIFILICIGVSSFLTPGYAESEAQGQPSAATCRGGEAARQPRRDSLFLVSRSKPQKLFSAAVEMLCPDEQYSYVHVNGSIYAINRATGSSEKLSRFDSGRNFEHLSPLFHEASVSFTQPFITNTLDNAGICCLMPPELPKISEHPIRNLPPHTEIEMCAATLQQGKLLLKTYHPSTGKTRYAFYDPATCLLEPNQYEITHSREMTLHTSLVWKGDYIWELSVSKRKVLKYEAYSISRQALVRQGDLILSDGEAPIISEEGLYVVNVVTHQIFPIHPE